MGLDAGIVPDPGLTYMNMALNYSANTLNDSTGHAIPAITGTYQFWVDENIFMYVPHSKLLGGYLAPWVDINVANGSLVGDISILGNAIQANGGGAGLADTLVEPFNLGWHFSRADLSVGDGFMAPTGRYNPLATNNVGSGYWGNHLTDAATVYITKNKGTSASLFTDMESHTTKRGTGTTPGPAFTMEWGIGQALPLAKDLSKIVQIGFVGYDQWQVSGNGGLVANQLPYYSAHALGAQGTFLAPKKGLNFFFKYYSEYNAKAHPEGRTFVFGGSWTLRIPKQ
jgi:hypothetical protein